MVLDFGRNITRALEEIGCTGECQELIIHPAEEKRTEEVVPVYGRAKWKIVDALNERYHSVIPGNLIKGKFDLYHWLYYQEEDELAYFLNEAGSNTLNYSEFKAPYRFLLWLGEKGFVIGIEQKGKGFPAEEIDRQGRKENEGAAFDFFRRCRSRIFFDDVKEARIVFMEWKF